MEASEDDISSLTEAQDKALSLIPIFSGLLSAYGSASIIRMVWQSREESTCYKRIMLGLSCSDLISSTVLSLQAFLLPADTSQRVWASGNDATCSLMGFFQQLSLSNVWYNGMLSFLFLWTIKYGITETRLRKRYEPWMHGLSIGFPLITAFILAAVGRYGELSMGHFCWISGSGASTIAYIVAGIPMFFFIIAVPTNNVVVYRHVRHTVQKSTQTSITPTECSPAHHEHQSDPDSAPNSNDECSTPNSSNDSSLFSNEEQREFAREQARQRSLQTRQAQRLQAVAFQAFLYVAAFLVSQLPTVILRVTAATMKASPKDDAQFFPLLVLQAVLWPLQGLFNYLVYSRPTYLRESTTI